MSMHFQVKLFLNTNENTSVKNVKMKTFIFSFFISVMTFEDQSKMGNVL